MTAELFTSPVPPGPSRLRWTGRDVLPAEVIEPLVGPGGPHEIVVTDVLGAPVEVFARRPRNLRALFDAAAERHPGRLLLVADDRTWTMAEAASDIDAVGRVLVERHRIRPGDRVAIVAANSPEHGLVMWAILSIGAVVVGLNGWWTSDELAYGVALTSPALITGDDRRLERLATTAVAAGPPLVRLVDLVAEARTAGGAPRAAAAVDEDDPAVVLFTSGTSGRPKGAILSHRNIVHFASVSGLGAAIGAALAPAALPDSRPSSQPASILASPMFHVSGMLAILMSGPALGTKLVFAPPGRWDATRHLELSGAHRISSWSGVPTQFWRLLRHPDLTRCDLSALRSAGGGGAPFPPELVRLFGEKLPGVSLANGYGMSETVGLGTLAAGPVMPTAPTSVGSAQPTVEVEVRDPGGQVVAEGQVGEIHLRSASVFVGYWDDPVATAECLDADRWYRTGDFGRTQGGLLYLESRMRDLILRGGENIYPIEIENRLIAHPDIDDAAVIGVDHPELGQEVKAFIVAREGSDLAPADVRRWVAAGLAAFKVPAHVERRAALPYTDTGKVLKRELERDDREGGRA